MPYPYQIKSFEEYKTTYKKSVEDPEGFWAEVAETFTWRKKWDNVLDWNFIEPKIEWFKGARLNITENCLDRHLETKGDQPAILWESNDPKSITRC
jgi:acetyl-CoA synthetase